MRIGCFAFRPRRLASTRRTFISAASIVAAFFVLTPLRRQHRFCLRASRCRAWISICAAVVQTVANERRERNCKYWHFFKCLKLRCVVSCDKTEPCCIRFRLIPSPMVFSFFKKPEKMLARPAAVPRPSEARAAVLPPSVEKAPATAVVPATVSPSPKAAKDDDSSLDYIDFVFSESSPDFQIEQEHSPVDSAAEEAAIL